MKLVLFDYVFERDKPAISGLSDVVWELAQSLQRLGHDVHLVGPYPTHLKPLEDTTLHPYQVPSISYRNVLGHLYIIWRGWREIQRDIRDADYVIAPEYLSTALFSCLGQTPTILITPGNIFERIASGYNPFDLSMTLVLKLAAKVSALRCQAIIAISRDMEKWWQYSGATPEKITVIPYGVATKTFRHIPGACQLLGWEDNKKHLLFVGRLSREKGMDTLLQAFASLLEKHDLDAHLHIIGDGPQFAAYQRLSEKYASRVTFYGWIKKPELPLYYSACDVVVVPSYTEPLGRIVLEAMSCSTLVIGSRVGGIPDLISERKTGLLFPTGDHDTLYQQLLWVLTHPAELTALAEAGHHFIIQHQTWDAVAKRMIEFIHPVAAHKNS
jgi:glycosyltransferase involved in cell wall biosynthesis